MFNIEESGINSLQDAMKKGEIKSRDLVMLFMERIMKYDKSGINLNSVLELNPDALFIADAMDREREMYGPRGPMHGIPVMLKDNINTCDKMHTSAGSLALSDSYASYDAFLVQRLREEGAVILGKTNMTEFANFMTKNMPNGYSSRGGQVLNPYNRDKDPWGSSTGSAVAVTTNLCTAAIGTETSGSIIGPAYINGIVGIKPTVGLISRKGIVPISSTHDTAGPMARTVEDASILLGALTGIDENDPATLGGKGRVYSDYTQFLDMDGLEGARIGVNMGFIDKLKEDEKRLFNNVLDIMSENGAILIYGCDLEQMVGKSVFIYEFKRCMNFYLSSLGKNAPVHTLKEIIGYNNKNPLNALKYGQTLLEKAEYETSGTLCEEEYLSNLLYNIKVSRTEGIDKVMDQNRLDVLLCPGMTNIAAIAGYPFITVPAGFTDEGMPYGIGLTGKAYSEPVLLKIAYAFEQKTKARRKPLL